ncbi:hypothetical protein P3S67_026943 [Capsicum chacoense]
MENFGVSFRSSIILIACFCGMLMMTQVNGDDKLCEYRFTGYVPCETLPDCPLYCKVAFQKDPSRYVDARCEDSGVQSTCVCTYKPPCDRD